MGGWREIGGGALVICSIDGAGVVALAVAADACRHWKQTYCVAGVVVRRTCFAACWRLSLGAIVGGVCVYVVGELSTKARMVAAREEQINASQSSGAAAGMRSPLSSRE